VAVASDYSSLVAKGIPTDASRLVVTAPLGRTYLIRKDEAIPQF
jgi:hypothetical protein